MLELAWDFYVICTLERISWSISFALISSLTRPLRQSIYVPRNMHRAYQNAFQTPKCFMLQAKDTIWLHVNFPFIFITQKQWFESSAMFHWIEQLVEDSITIRRYDLLHSMKCVYYPVITFTHYGWQDTLATIFMQAIPCFFMDFFNPEKIRLLAVCRKIKSMKNVITFFMSKRIHFDNSNVVHEVYDR